MKNNNLKYIFLGSPKLCLPILEELKNNFGLPEFIITNEDKPVGRKQIITETPVSFWAKQNNVKCLKPESFTPDFVAKLDYYDLAIVVAYGKILPEIFIQKSKFGTINIHYSLLPKLRGASPIESSILQGFTETGVTIQQMVKKLDAGPVISFNKINLTGQETATSLEETLNNIASLLLTETIDKITSKTSKPAEQNELDATYCYKIKKEDAELKETDSDEIKWRKYRAYIDWPRAFFFDKNGKRIIVTDASFIEGRFIINKVIKEGEKEKNYKSI